MMTWEILLTFASALFPYLVEHEPLLERDPVKTVEPINLLHSYDFIIVGAGSAGSALANRLTEKTDWNVLLLEAGGQETEATRTPAMFTALPKTTYNWNYTTTRQQMFCQAFDGKCPYARGKSLGGSSAVNGMIFVRGYKSDYDRWGQDNPGWSFADVLPYFKKSQDNQIEGKEFRGVGGPVIVTQAKSGAEITPHLMQAAEEFGWKNDECMDYEGDCIETTSMSIRNGQRCSASTAYLEPISYVRENLHILTGSRAKKIIFDGNTAKGVEFVRENIAYQAFVDKEVILSSGSIDSPKLLMLSGIGPKDHLKSVGITPVVDLPVGDNLQDHAYVSLIFNASQGTLNFDMLNSSLSEYMEKHTGYMATNAHQTMGYSTLGTEGTPIIQYIFATGLGMPGHEIRLVTTVMRPKSRGAVRLASSSYLDNPLIDLNIYGDSFDLKQAIQGLSQGLKLLKSPVLAKYNLTLQKEEICRHLEDEDMLECAAKTASDVGHPVGTVKMGPKNKAGVVNNRLQVYGIDNLRVVDASIAPFVVSTNTNQMSIMVGERGADLIKKDHHVRALKISE